MSMPANQVPTVIIEADDGEWEICPQSKEGNANPYFTVFFTPEKYREAFPPGHPKGAPPLRHCPCGGGMAFWGEPMCPACSPSDEIPQLPALELKLRTHPVNHRCTKCGKKVRVVLTMVDEEGNETFEPLKAKAYPNTYAFFCDSCGATF